MQPEKKKKRKKAAKNKVSPAISPDKNDEQKPAGFDFGGLPSRDLKKSFGCG